MDDHYWTVRIPQNALGIRAQHPAMENCMAALAHHNEAGLDYVGFVDDLLRRMAQDNVSFDFNVALLGAFAQRDETFLVALLPIFKHSVELRAFGGFGRPNYRDKEELGFQIDRKS